MGGGILLFAIVLCISLLFRLLISQFFSHKVFDEDLSAPLMRGIIAPSNGNETLEELAANPKGHSGIKSEGG